MTSTELYLTKLVERNSHSNKCINLTSPLPFKGCSWLLVVFFNYSILITFCKQTAQTLIRRRVFCLSPPVFVLTVSRRRFFCGSFLLFKLHIFYCYAILSVLVLLSLSNMGLAWYLIVSIPDLCLPLYIDLII